MPSNTLYPATLKIKQSTKDRFEARMKYKDTQDSALSDLLDIADRVEGRVPPDSPAPTSSGATQ